MHEKAPRVVQGRSLRETLGCVGEGDQLDRKDENGRSEGRRRRGGVPVPNGASAIPKKENRHSPRRGNLERGKVRLLS
jgi:hypothetical protein